MVLLHGSDAWAAGRKHVIDLAGNNHAGKSTFQRHQRHIGRRIRLIHRFAGLIRKKLHVSQIPAFRDRLQVLLLRTVADEYEDHVGPFTELLGRMQHNLEIL